MIKNLVFDIGNVLLGFRWRDMFREHGISEAETERIGWEMFNSEIWWGQLDKGQTTLEEAIVSYRKEFPQDIETIEWFIRNADQMPVGRPEIWELVRQLKEKGSHIYLLSNYSEELVWTHIGNTPIPSLAEGGVISYQVGVIKPDPRIYQILLEKYDLKAEECLFFDDRKDNVEGAKAVGMEAVEVTSGEMLQAELERLLREIRDGVVFYG